MAKIKQDIVGLYLVTGSAIVRPNIETQFKVGDRVKTYVYNQCTDVRVQIDEIKEFWTRGLASYLYDVFKAYLDNDTFEKLITEFNRFEQGNPIANVGLIPRKPFDRTELHMRVAAIKVAEKIQMGKYKSEIEREQIVRLNTPVLITTVDNYLNYTQNI